MLGVLALPVYWLTFVLAAIVASLFASYRAIMTAFSEAVVHHAHWACPNTMITADGDRTNYEICGGLYGLGVTILCIIVLVFLVCAGLSLYLEAKSTVASATNNETRQTSAVTGSKGRRGWAL